ncbi:MFS transporter [Fulvivirgaceae bacterium BMA10]|uniref:MFS transporter n=1 Tax=Splendidivirga corallicola TaxID=3051826 RepID=A0ABT8KQ92_9BACT|nr:MFS transporter [Fulvivirgaceae bacterium BMA10]
MELNNKKMINAWSMYDWANSVYSLVITSTIFPIYYYNVARGANDSSEVDFFGIMVNNSVLYSYALSFSFLFTALILPLLSGIADYSGKKKLFLKIFVLIGSLSCMGLFFFVGENIEWGIICSVLASIGYSSSLVFYDAFLPEIVTQDKLDSVSAKGYTYGYIGSVILMIISVVLIQGFSDLFGEGGEGTALATRVSFLLVGLWWIGFSLIPLIVLPDNIYNREGTKNMLTEGYREILKVWNSLKRLKVLKTFLLAFFFYNMGVQTVMYLATSFGKDALQLPDASLMATILIIQLVAALGAYLFAKLSKAKGNKFALLVMVFIWVGICLAAYFVETEYQFYALAFVVGAVMGGIQSLSRATYAKLIPENSIDHTSYFSFYDVAYNLSIVFGTFSYGFIFQLTGSMRNSALALALFFIVGLGFLLLLKVPLAKGYHQKEAIA